MFKNYLRIQPAPVQLLLFLSFWCALMLLGLLIQPLYIKAAIGIGTDQLQQFAESEIYKYPNVIFVSNALFQVSTFLAPALVYAYLADPAPGAYLGFSAPGKKIQIAVVILLSVCLIVVVGPITGWLKQLDLGNTSKELDRQRDGFINAYLHSGNGWAVLKSIFLIAVVPAFCEELFFRGMVFKFAQSMFKKWWLSIVVSALLFAAFHTSISEFIPIFIAGLVLGWVYYITSSLWMSVLMHLLFNGLELLLSLYENPGLEKSLQSPYAILMAFTGGLLVMALGLFFLYRKRTTLPESWSVVWPPLNKDNTWIPGQKI